MPRKRKEYIFEYNGYRVGKTTNSPNYQRFWTNEKGNTDHRTLATADPDEAIERLIQYVQENRELKNERPDGIQYLDLVNRFFKEHVPTMASPKTAITHIKQTRDFIDAGLLASDFGPRYQRQLGQRLKDFHGWKDSTLKRYMTTLQRVLTWAVREELISDAPRNWTFKEGELKRRKTFTVEQIAALLDAAPEHVKRFIIAMLCTCARPGALLHLNRFRCDLEENIIDLHPEGWPRTKKINPIIPMTAYMRPLVETAGNFIIEKDGKQIRRDTMGKMFNKVRDSIGLDKELTVYCLRHTIAKHLRVKRIPDYQRKMMLGHADTNTTDRFYSGDFEPEELIQAVKAIDDFIEEIDRVAPRPIYPKTQVRVNRVLAEAEPEFKDSEKVIKFNN